ncbi:MAG: hypothetical protein C0506_01640 [Anaerolinea sp.]|nr:hypothetical protein [Anaerolinea sp.]
MQKLQRREGPGIGFGAAVREQPRAMLLAAMATSAADVRAALDAGADAVILRATAESALSQLDGLASDKVSVGVITDALSEASAAALAKAGCDFVISTLEQTESAAVDTERMGHILVADEGAEDNTLRALAPLGLDALYVERKAGGVMLAHQLGLVRLASFSSTPLLVTVDPGASVAELRVLRDSGVGGVAAPLGTTSEQLKTLIETLKAVPPPKKSRREGADMAIVPSPAARPAEEEDDGDEDDD